MKRRDFLKYSLGFITLAGVGTLFKRSLFASDLLPDLVVVKSGLPDKMFDAGIKALGGMERFVKKNSKVLIKPNIGWNVDPERAANTNPVLVGRIIEHCFKAGAKEVIVFDHTCNYWKDCYTNSGIEYSVKKAGGKIIPADRESLYQQIEIKDAQFLRYVKVHEYALEADVFINVPVLKHHGSALFTAGIKNLMGIVWDRGIWHAKDLHGCIAEFPLWRKPDLTVIDAYRVMFKNGPRGVSLQDIREERLQILSTDIVAADSLSSKVLGYERTRVPYLVKAHSLGYGRMDIENLFVKEIIL